MRPDGDFQEFYQANYGRIVAMATAVLCDRHGAEDVAQEAFARALSRWPRLGGYDLCITWPICRLTPYRTSAPGDVSNGAGGNLIAW